MHAALTTLVDRLDSHDVAETDVIAWGSPVPSFGDPTTSRVATLGLNPSNREFVDQDGNELEGAERRFHTLRSLGLPTWADADTRDLQLIVDSCCAYFRQNPYDRWFKKLDYAISATGSSFYDPETPACHLDLIPYATSQKWTELSLAQRRNLRRLSENILGQVVRDSRIEILVLNGRSVVEQFQDMAGVTLHRTVMSEWSLHRQGGPDVLGIAYVGTIEELGGVSLGRKLRVLGYNHNLQSSFGVTSAVMTAIRDWISQVSSHDLE